MDYEMARRFEPWLLAVAGVAWFGYGADAGFFGLVAAAVPGALLLGAAVASMFFPGDRLIPRTGAAGALVGVLYALAMLLFAPLGALLLGVLSVIAALAAARLAADDLVIPEGQEAPPTDDLRVLAEIAVDEAVLGSLTTVMGVYSEPVQPRVGRELDQTLDWLRANGWLDEPASFHETPPPIGPAAIAPARTAGIDYEVMRFDSEFEPRAGAPGRERWLGYHNNRTAEVRIVRTARSRDWLICVHGLAMGRTWLDLRAMGAGWLHRRGLNLAFPVLPLHGPRANNAISGAGFISGDVANTLHALAQTAWDIRRLVAWLREEGAERIGIAGMSLGGYSTALVASLEDGLDCAIAGIPPSEFGAMTLYHASARALALAAAEDITPERIGTALRPVSPLALQPRIPPERRFIFGAMADRFVSTDQVETLWRHWDQPEILWYPGAHLGFRFHHSVREFVDGALRRTLLAER